MNLSTEEKNKIFMEVLGEMTEEILEKSIDKKLGRPEEETPRSFFVNPYDFTSTTGQFRDRRTGLSWDTLRILSDRNPIISAIVNTRLQQVSAFTSPVRLQEAIGNNPLGYKVIHKQKDRKLTPGEQQFVEDLEDYIWHCGDPSKFSIYDRDNFDVWMAKIVRDSLTFDAAVAELIPTRKGAVYEWHAIDAATIRMAMAKQDVSDEEQKTFVQLMNGQIVTEYAPDEIMYGIRNPTTKIQNNGYGVSELEQLISVVNNILNAMQHNSMFFRNGAAVKGLINIKPGSKQGGVPREQFEAFKRAWKGMITGAHNAWTTPIVQSDGVEFVNMGSTNREMEFSQYLDFLVKITCAVYAIDPAEINFYMASSSGGGSPMFESNQESKLKMSKDKGLRPLLNKISRWVNQFILKRVTDDFYFAFSGIDSKDEKDIINVRKEEVGAYKTVDEVRADAGLKPLGEESGGNVILNPQYIQYLQQKSMEAMQAGGDGGSEEADEGVETPPDGQGEDGEENDGEVQADQKQKSRDEPEGKGYVAKQVEKSLSMANQELSGQSKFIRITLE